MSDPNSQKHSSAATAAQEPPEDPPDLWYSIQIWVDCLWFFSGSDRTLAKDVTDCAAILETIAAHDEKDSTSIGRDSYDFTSALVEDVKGMKIGIPRDYFGEVLHTLLSGIRISHHQNGTGWNLPLPTR